MWEKINNFLKGQIVTSIIYIALGACLVFMPVSTVNVICKFVFGILLILVGLYHILIYVAEKLNSTIFDLFSGGVLMVLGIFLFMNPQIVVKLLPILLGTFILVDSIWSLKGSLKLKKRGAGSWKFLLLGSIIFIALGISLVVNPFTMVKYTVIFAGWIFLCNGVIDMIYLILLRKGLKEIKQDVEAVDALYEEIYLFYLQWMQMARLFLVKIAVRQMIWIQKLPYSRKNRLHRNRNMHHGVPVRKKNPQKRIFLDLLKKKRKIMPLLARKISAQKKLTEKFLKWKNPWMMYRQTKMIRQWMG